MEYQQDKCNSFLSENRLVFLWSEVWGTLLTELCVTFLRNCRTAKQASPKPDAPSWNKTRRRSWQSKDGVLEEFCPPPLPPPPSTLPHLVVRQYPANMGPCAEEKHVSLSCSATPCRNTSLLWPMTTSAITTSSSLASKITGACRLWADGTLAQRCPSSPSRKT